MDLGTKKNRAVTQGVGFLKVGLQASMGYGVKRRDPLQKEGQRERDVLKRLLDV